MSRLRVPSAATLRRYGITKVEWLEMLQRQGRVCAVCKRLPKNGRLCIDHEHVPGWKHMVDDERKQYVRGLLCFFCNHYYMGRGITVERAEAVVEFLRAYRARLNHSQENRSAVTKQTKDTTRAVRDAHTQVEGWLWE